MTIIFAHRGASRQCPENTMSAYKRAVEIGAEGIEIDVQLSKDSAPVVIHDRTLKRTTSGRGTVTQTSFEDLKKLDAGSWFSSNFKNERIPSLEEVLIWANQYPDLWLNVELKYYNEYDDQLARTTIPLIKKFRSEKNTVISSFEHQRLLDVHKLWSKIETAPLYKGNLNEPCKYAKKLKAKALHPQYKLVTESQIKTIHSHGIKIRPYTVNEERWIRQFLDWEVDGLMTDVPDLALNIMHNKQISQQRQPWWKSLWSFVSR
ncbi:glycerophosphodiester phosphodiesterase [Bacillus sp. NTK071]|uniref:glycerophosphodiester phosphodiesterase n=1 Tax=Bacillus sp. NTK071 TaxID=2802175 RepID=UPI001A8FCC5F|nr:glycerophosphodiester phosphodiesterase family protein [Bacillus sp. NTK071]MBN8208178.1 glycerophosphodiester phosphodiesterase [Bacillus sp. NTK071]